MAWITAKKDGRGFLVRWRDDGKARSKFFKDRVDADAFREQVETNTAALKSRRLADRVLSDRSLGIPGWDDPIAEEKHPHAVANYLRRIVESDRELRESSKRTYLVGLKTHIEGTGLGRTRVEHVTPELVRDFWAELKDAPGVRRNVYLLLSKTFSQAVMEGIIDISPMKRSGVRQPSKQRREDVLPLTVDQIEQLADHARNTRDRLAILLMAYAGLRAGEVGGLRGQDVDLKRCRISIRQQVVQVSGRKSITPLKTKAARRTVAVACSVVEELQQLVPDAASDGRLFHGLDGGYWSAIRINEAVHRAAAAAGLPETIHSHMLRHTAVSLLIDDGANPKAIQSFVGHANITETLGTYGHLFDTGGEALAASMERRREEHRNGD